MKATPDNARKSVCLFIASSDRTRDVFEITFSHFGAVWANCPWPRYVGLTTPQLSRPLMGFTPLYAEEESGWRTEFLAQLRQLPDEVCHIVLLLDDFLLLRRVEQEQLSDAVAQAIARNLAYARLVPTERSAVVRFLRFLKGSHGRYFEPLQPDELYPSSLQAAVWKRDYLLRSLEQPGSIWDFEYQSGEPGEHYAANKKLLHYRHVVERGKWMPYTASLMGKCGIAFSAGERSEHCWLHGLRWYAQKIRFAIVGYLFTRLKRAMRRR